MNNKWLKTVFLLLGLLLIRLEPVCAAPSIIAVESPIISENIQVENQQGHQLSFYTDLIKNKTVAINFIFTTCSSSCPLATAVFKQVQKQLGAQKIHLISISVDPNTDTPARLNTFAQQFKTATGWDFITGDRATINALLQNLEAYSADKTLHTNMVLIGNDKTHTWTRLYGLPSAEAIITAIKQVSPQP
ncbi:MAG: SCO family protein [Methylococcaceae bacterium]|nr:SCO family protein [Methylococcaceae bacterium]